MKHWQVLAASKFDASKSPITDVPHDQSINEITSYSYNDANQNETQAIKGTRIFGLNEAKAVDDNRTVFDEESSDVQE